jgi:hypothetical protein
MSEISEEKIKGRSRGKQVQTRIEVETPQGIQILNALFWIGGLSGLTLGILTINQGFFEFFFDMQIILILTGIGVAVLGGAMFVVASGIVSGANWSLNAAKQVAGISIAWSAIGTALAFFGIWNLPGIEFSYTLYAVVIWHLVFGIAVGFIAIRYLYQSGTSIRKYAKYVTQEIVTDEDTRILQKERPIANLRRFCWQCGATLRQNETICPKCGARRDIDHVHKEVTRE